MLRSARGTKQIRLGLGVVILPYHHPNRVAERVAMLDHLSEGRVDFGTGRSAPYELTGMGIDPRDSREMWEESLTMVPKILGVRLVRVRGQVLAGAVSAGTAQALSGPASADLGGRAPARDLRDRGVEGNRPCWHSVRALQARLNRTSRRTGRTSRRRTPLEVSSTTSGATRPSEFAWTTIGRRASSGLRR